MTSNINLKDINNLKEKLEKLEKLKQTSSKLIEIAEYVLDKECPFEFDLNITIIKEHSINSESDVTFDMSPDSFSSPEDFLENLYKMNDKIQDKEKEKKERINLSLNGISNKAFLAVLEKLVIDVNQTISNNLNTIKLNG
tara:strand:- start:1286 stop:1705 length:420 start_codon:yes stop_codon:yes gene_type:complete